MLVPIEDLGDLSFVGLHQTPLCRCGHNGHIEFGNKQHDRAYDDTQLLCLIAKADHDLQPRWPGSGGTRKSTPKLKQKALQNDTAETRKHVTRLHVASRETTTSGLILFLDW